jgi:hypothetical protein
MKRFGLIFSLVAMFGLSACSGKNTLVGPIETETENRSQSEKASAANLIPVRGPVVPGGRVRPTPRVVPSRPASGQNQVLSISATPENGATLQVYTQVTVTVRGVAAQDCHISGQLLRGGMKLGGTSDEALDPFPGGFTLTIHVSSAQVGDSDAIRIIMTDANYAVLSTADFPIIYHWTN